MSTPPLPALLELPSSEFLKHCTVENIQTSGPGGQKKNRVKSGVKLKIKGSPYVTSSNQSRQPKENLADAIKKAKLLIALNESQEIQKEDLIPFPGTGTRLNTSNPQYHAFVFQVTNRLRQNSGDLKSTASDFKLSPSALNRLIHREKLWIEKTNQIRSQFDLSPLKA